MKKDMYGAGGVGAATAAAIARSLRNRSYTAFRNRSAFMR